MKKTILTIAFTLTALVSFGQRVQPTDSLTTRQDVSIMMTHKAADHLNKAGKSLGVSIATAALSGWFIHQGQSELDSKELTVIGGGFAVASLITLIRVPIQLKRSSAYFTASAYGVKITF